MADTAAKAEIRQMLGIVPGFFEALPEELLDSEWASFKGVELSDQTAIPNKYKELIGIAVAGATRCRYCAYFHTEAARLFGATDEEIGEAALMAKHTMGWSSYLNAVQYDYVRFAHEVDQISAHIRKHAAVPA
ncbi:MAG: carboxymuconolactone decarboxylase family protein [Streptosporangiaceae bacterium]